MKSLKMMINKILEIVCILLFAFITIVGTYQIITRYVFNAPSTVSEELLTFSFTWMALLASALVFGKRDHMRMEFVANLFKGKSAVILSIISEILVLIFSAVVLVYGGIQITKLTALQITASLGVHMSYVYSVVPISGVLIVIYNIININELILQLKSENSR
ncbi:TRAP-type C4-dicarboxylate transport system permease small subunit [Clostridium tetanomorphum]|uniref:TRAP transporter small permease n=1 Tax=Clostridium tetanomorphum TaxID=1553 RepID=A0A923E8U2_CLOTT|nr:TRAP transporter small permease [Clostridium tetanomorphum]KAJ52605.1 putative TRAP C4-dicarboxylate transport system DctQ subunit [Clostridium tetanomorphum DSM 665]MBC2396841.1 TRAP transporter small permease [Clostridium tetanomorphum]MBP1863197.1 TRAP-type C4-dicarboxylate transport system permease small subunit [Clostridium tetanomorphum]NRS84305.1 TRAP-type C4-dicarboxylate transport system permease small subunit [Clostridium tetanomorphum]NRZ97519.1 TRAP-type C4-dicarboxylate transpo